MCVPHFRPSGNQRRPLEAVIFGIRQAVHHEIDRVPGSHGQLFHREFGFAIVDDFFDQLFGANDPALYKLAMQVLKGEHAWLEQGIVSSFARIDKAKRRPTGDGGAVPNADTVTAIVGATQ